MIRWISFAGALLLCAALTACGADKAAPSGWTLTYKDQSVTVSSQPRRVAVLTTPLLNMSCAAGGLPIARPTTGSPIPAEAEALPELGQAQHINMETLLSLSPDFVLGEVSQNRKLEPLLTGSGIPCLLVNYDGIDDNVPLMRLLGRLYDTEPQAEAAIASYEEKLRAAEAEGASHAPARIAVLRATGKDVTAETASAICASMAAKLHMRNVVTEGKSLPASAKTVPYSLEQLAADDPDIIFIVTMGRQQEIAAVLDQTLRGNPAWSGLSAVRTGRVYFLPQELFLLNPGMRTPEAMEQLLRLAYPA